MRTEHLHQTLSPQAHAALFDALRGRAEREHRTAVQRFGTGWSTRLRTLARRLAARRVQGAPVVQLMEG
jgi:hypothetical protein